MLYENKIIKDCVNVRESTGIDFTEYIFNERCCNWNTFSVGL